MRSLLPALLLLAPLHAFASDTPILADGEAHDGTAIELTDFTGGVGASDAAGGGNAVIIQMIQPAAPNAAAATVSAGPYARAGGH